MKAPRNIYKVFGAYTVQFFATKAEAVHFAKNGLYMISRIATKRMSKEDLVAFLAARNNDARSRAVRIYDFDPV